MSIDAASELKLLPLIFDDVDRFCDWEQGLGFQIEATQLSAGGGEVKFDHFAFPGLLVSHFSTKPSMQNFFALPEGVVLFAICRTELPALWCGKHFPPTFLAVLHSKREQWVVLPGGWECYEFIVSEDLIYETEILTPASFAKTKRPEHACVPLVGPVTRNFLQKMDAAFERARGGNGSSGNTIHKQHFFSFIIDGLQQVIDAGLSAMDAKALKPARRSGLVKMGIDFVYANIRNDISAYDMAKALGVSYRVLSYAFRDSLGVSPYQYILTEKLHGVRRELKSESASVIQSCVSFGFETPSRFARQYKRLFGELPSQTRANHRTPSLGAHRVPESTRCNWF